MTILHLLYNIFSLMYLTLYECIYLLESCNLLEILLSVYLSLYFIACSNKIGIISWEWEYSHNKKLALTDHFHHEYNKI